MPRSSEKAPATLTTLALSLLLLPALSPSVLVGQSTVFTGQITDAETADPLSGAQVALPAVSAGDITGDDGRYEFEVAAADLAADTVLLRVQLVGYATASQTISTDGDTVRTDVALESEPVRLQEVTIAPAGFSSMIPTAPVPGGQARHLPPGFDREAYDRIRENPFLAPRANPLSTFGVDVDRASYANVRRFLTGGSRPPKDAVRIEELINYFQYDYPAPDGSAPFSITTNLTRAPWAPSHHLLRIGLQAPDVALEDLPPSNLVFLLDVSGSMGSPDKLPLVKAGLRLLVNQLRPEDRVAIVVYAGAAGLVLPPTPGDRKEKILATLNELGAGGSTAGGAGLKLAYSVARENHIEGGNNRIILTTDGDFNVGVSSDAEMTRLVEEKREQGTFLSVLGFGTGNLQDAKMEQISNHGNGNFAYIDNLLEAKRSFVTEIGGTLLTVAKDVKIQVEFNPAVVGAYRLIGYENRLLRAEDFDDDEKDAGEIGAGHSVTALYEIIPAEAEDAPEVRRPDTLRYQQNRVREDARAVGELGYLKLRFKAPDGDESRLLQQVIPNRLEEPSIDFRFASAVASFGLILRDSEHRGDATLEDVVEVARESRGADPEEYRAEFIRLAEAALAIGDDEGASGQ